MLVQRCVSGKKLPVSGNAAGASSSLREHCGTHTCVGEPGRHGAHCCGRWRWHRGRTLCMRCARHSQGCRLTQLRVHANGARCCYACRGSPLVEALSTMLVRCFDVTLLQCSLVAAVFERERQRLATACNAAGLHSELTPAKSACLRTAKCESPSAALAPASRSLSALARQRVLPRVLRFGGSSREPHHWRLLMKVRACQSASYHATRGLHHMLPEGLLGCCQSLLMAHGLAYCSQAMAAWQLNRRHSRELTLCQLQTPANMTPCSTLLARHTALNIEGSADPFRAPVSTAGCFATVGALTGAPSPCGTVAARSLPKQHTDAAHTSDIVGGRKQDAAWHPTCEPVRQPLSERQAHVVDPAVLDCLSMLRQGHLRHACA